MRIKDRKKYFRIAARNMQIRKHMKEKRALRAIIDKQKRLWNIQDTYVYFLQRPWLDG